MEEIKITFRRRISGAMILWWQTQHNYPKYTFCVWFNFHRVWSVFLKLQFFIFAFILQKDKCVGY